MIVFAIITKNVKDYKIKSNRNKLIWKKYT